MFTLTYSNLATFKDCPFKFKTRNIDGLRPVVTKDSLAIGSAFHLFREHGNDMTKVEEYFAQFSPLSQEEADQIEINWSIVKGLCSIAPAEPDVRREIEFDLPLINPATGHASRSFRLGGKADGIKLVDRPNTFALIEEKTRGGNINKSDIDRLSIDTQVMHYIVNLEDAEDVQIREVWYRYYRKPSIRQKQGETVDAFCRRVEEDYKERPDFYRHEERLIFPRNQLDAYREDLWQLGKAILYSKRLNLWYRNTSHCIDWGGCEYLPLCRGEDVDGLYKVEKPNEELDAEGSGDNEFFAN